MANRPAVQRDPDNIRPDDNIQPTDTHVDDQTDDPGWVTVRIPFGTLAAASLPALDDEELQSIAAHYSLQLVNMHRSLDALRPALASVATPYSPELAQGLAATENAWRDMEAEFGLLTAQEVAERCGSRAKGRSSLAHDKRRAGQLFGISRLNATLFPGFQIDQTGTIRPVIARLVSIIKEHGRTEEDLAQWMCLPSGYLDDARPVDLLGQQDDAVVAAAEGHFGVQW